MRTIKFRALHEGVWYYQTLEEMLTITLAAFRLGEYKTQFIGIKDKNGKEVYEGDIVSNGYEELPIICIATSFGTKNEKEFTNYSTAWEVVGNIYETPTKSD